jgi:hypothetical protein
MMQILRDLLKAHRKLRIFIIPPLHREIPMGFKEDMAVCQVSLYFITIGSVNAVDFNFLYTF